MEPNPNDSLNADSDNQYQLATWMRIYVHGILAFVILFAMAYVVTRIMPVFSFTDSLPLAFILSVLTVLLAPPLVGSLILYGVFPLIGMKAGWRGVTGWDQQLFARISSARKHVKIVIINWPSKEVRTMGVLTRTFKVAGSTQSLAAVYVPTATKRGGFGFIRVVSLDELEFTDLTFKEWQLYQLTLGSEIPLRYAIEKNRM